MMRKFLISCTLLTIAAAVWAQAPDPPSRVARLNYENGQVSFRPGSVEDWTAASLNYPLTTGDHLWTDANAQAEMHVGSTAIRMDQQTALSILNLDDNIVQLSLTQGSMNVHIQYLGEGESFEVDTPNIAVSLLRPGDYRVDADSDNAVTMITVRGGEAEATGGAQAFSIHPRESARVTGTDQVTQEVNQAIPVNDFEQWCASRDQRESASVSARYVPREMIGYEDLDQYGMWREVPPYGWVWTPRTVAVGWAPYHYGHWAWVEPWGWTWIDDAPWGFAPFHYGRWAFAGGAWVWVPGRMVMGVRPVYAPALVAFVGGPHFAVGVGVGGGVAMAAWFPLGPGEVYRPAYHVSEVYVRNINVVHVRDVTVINRVNVVNVTYVNQRVVGAVTVVPHDAFVGARPVAVAAVRVDGGVIARAQVVGTAAPIVPVRASVLAHAGPVVAPPPRFAERAVVARATPPPPPVSFAAKQQMLAANGGRPLDPGQMSALRQNAPARNPMVRSAGAPRGPAGMGNGGFRPAGQMNAQPQRPMNNDRPPSAYQPRNDRPTNAQPERPANNTERPAATQSSSSQPGRESNQERRGEKNKKKNERKNDKNDDRR